MNKLTKIAGVLVGVALVTASAHAAIPTEITTLFTDLLDVWGDVKDFVIGVVVFFTILGVALMVKRRK